MKLERFFAWRPNYRIEVDGSTDVELLDCVVDGPRGTDSQCVLVADAFPCSNVRINGGLFRHARHHAIQLGTSTNYVNGFQVVNALIEGDEFDLLTQAGVYVWKANNGQVSNNTIKNCTTWGIYEDVNLGNNNLFLGNRLFNNTSGPISFGALNSQAIRNVAQANVKVSDSGGFRQTVDGWALLTSTASGTEMPRFGVTPARYRAARGGSLTGLVVETNVAITANSFTITVYKNSTGAADAAGGPTSVATTVSSGSLNVFTQARNVTTFNAGDELFLWFTKSGTPTSANIRCSFEVEI